MEPKIQYGPVTYTGYDHKNNGKFIVERGKGTYTYVSYQNDEFTKTICGYVVKQNDDTYKAFQLGTFETDFKDRNVKFFDSLEDGVHYMKKVYIQELYPEYSEEQVLQMLDQDASFLDVNRPEKNIIKEKSKYDFDR